MSKRDDIVTRLRTDDASDDLLISAASLLETDDDEIERLRAEVERLMRILGDPGTTHAEGCSTWGPKHWQCALNERDALLARVEAAEKAIERVLPAKAREHIDCWKVNYGLDRYDKVTAARRWAEAGGPSDGPIMALATAIEWLEST